MAFGASAVARCALLLVSCSAVLGGDVLDLTHTFDENTLYWDAADKFVLTPVDPPLHGVTEFSYAAKEHGGTHMDAPSHYTVGGKTIDEIPVTDLVYKRAAIVDMRTASALNPDVLMSKADLDAWIADNGPFEYPTIVMVKTGWADFWPNRVLYFAESGGVKHFPGIDADVAEALANDPAVIGVGIDTASICGGMNADPTCEAQQLIADADKYVIVNIADMSPMPPKGGRMTVLPMKIGGGSGAPCRVLVDPAPHISPCPGNSKGHGNGAAKND